VIVGGVIPTADFAKLEALGVRAVFGPESPIEAVVSCVRRLASPSFVQGEASP